MCITQQLNKLTKRCCNVVTTFDITHIQYLKKKHILIEYFRNVCIIFIIFNHFSRLRTRGIYIPTRNIFGQTLLQRLSQTSRLQHSSNVVTTLCVSWDNQNGYQIHVRVLFVLGLSNKSNNDLSIIHGEIVQYRDILLLNMMEHYQRIVYKGMAAVIWIQKHISDKTNNMYIFKTNNDICINIYELINFIRRSLDHVNIPYIVGARCHKVYIAVTRINNSKITVPPEEILDEKYPYFCMGVISEERRHIPYWRLGSRVQF